MSNKANLELTHVSSIENVDFAFYDWLDLELNLSCNSKNGFKKVPVLWVTPERAFQVKQNKEFRDINGTLNIPMITVERTSISKDVKYNGTYYANLPPNDNRQIIARRINQKKTSEFANADNEKKNRAIGFVSRRKNEKIVYQYDSMLLPVYANFTYNITVFTQFQQQMNELLQPFLARTGSNRYFLVERDGYKYECLIQPDFETKNNIASMEEEERRYITGITVRVLAKLILPVYPVHIKDKQVAPAVIVQFTDDVKLVNIASVAAVAIDAGLVQLDAMFQKLFVAPVQVGIIQLIFLR